MRVNTIVTMGSSLIFAGVAVFLAKGWINDAVSEDFAPLPAQAIKAAPVDGVPVLIADADLAFGDVLDPSLLAVVDFPETAVPMGAYSDISDIAPGARALIRMSAGEPILGFKVSGPDARASLSLRISPGLRAATVRVTDMDGVAGFVLPGDRVDVIYMRDEETLNSRYSLDMRADVVLQDVRVLAVDQTASESVEGALPAATVTLEVALEDAQALRIAQDTGTLSLALRPAGEGGATPTTQVARADIAPIAKAAPTRRRAVAAPKVKSTDDVAKVVVIRGEDRNEVSVVAEKQSFEPQLAGGL